MADFVCRRSGHARVEFQQSKCFKRNALPACRERPARSPKQGERPVPEWFLWRLLLYRSESTCAVEAAPVVVTKRTQLQLAHTAAPFGQGPLLSGRTPVSATTLSFYRARPTASPHVYTRARLAHLELAGGACRVHSTILTAWLPSVLNTPETSPILCLLALVKSAKGSALPPVQNFLEQRVVGRQV